MSPEILPQREQHSPRPAGSKLTNPQSNDYFSLSSIFVS